MNKNLYLDGMIGLIVGDAVGVPYEFSERDMLAESPVTDMIGYGAFNVPAGTWSDDSSMALATLDSLQTGYDPENIMKNFSFWMNMGKYTPFGRVFDIGVTCMTAIRRYDVSGDINTCGCCNETDNGNGSLMRILPACLYFYEKERTGAVSIQIVIEKIHELSALTHAHLRSKIACGLYYFLVKEMIDSKGSLAERLQIGLDKGFAFYETNSENVGELAHFSRMRDINSFAALRSDEIISSGYVVASFEAAVWSLANTDDYKSCVLKAVNLGGDTDTVAAIAGGLAGLYYGYDSIPDTWLKQIAKRKWLEDMCQDRYHDLERIEH